MENRFKIIYILISTYCFNYDQTMKEQAQEQTSISNLILFNRNKIQSKHHYLFQKQKKKLRKVYKKVMAKKHRDKH